MSQQPGGESPYGPYGQQPPPPPDEYGQYGQQPPPPPDQYDQYGQYGQQPPPPPTPDQYGQRPPPAPPLDQYGQQSPAPPGQYGQPDQYGLYGQYGQPPGPGGYYGPGFVPVPTAVQPGIIPLRPLTLGEIYDGAFRAIRSNPLVMFGLAIIVVGVWAILQLGLTVALIGRVERAAQAGVADFDAFFDAGTVVGLILSSVAVGLATLILEGLAIISVSESVIGRKISLGEVWQRARGKLWRLVVLSLLLGAAGIAAVVGGIAVVIAFSIAYVEGAGQDPLALLLLVPLLLLALAAVVAFFGVRLMFAPCVIMLEGTGIFASLARSWRLSKGNFWRLFGIMLLTSILVGVLVSILSVPFSMFGSVFATQGDILVPLVLSSLGQLVGAAISIPVMAAVLALLYVDVRMRKEGLDVEIARAAQGG